MNESLQENSIKDIAALMQNPGKDTSSTIEIMKGLTRAFYNIPKKEGRDDAVFLSMVILDARAAQLKAKAKEKVNVNEIVTISGEASALVSKMQQSKSTVAFHSQFAQDLSPLSSSAAQLSIRGEDLGNAIGQYIIRLQGRLATIEKDIQSGKSKKEIDEQLQSLSTEWGKLEIQVNKTGGDMDVLLQRLGSFKHQAEVHTPRAEPGVRSGSTFEEKPE